MRAPSIRVRVALVLTAALVPTVLAVPGVAAAASPTAAPTAAAPFGPLPARPTCATTTPELRYLVLVPAGSPAPLVRAGIALACGRTTAYYPQIGVVVATSRDAAFDDRLGLDRAYSAQAEAIGGTHPGAGGSTDDGEATVGADRSAATATSIAADRSLEQWDMTQIRAQQANAVNPGRADVVVGVLDSGVDQDHPDLVGAIDPALSAGCTSGAADPSPRRGRTRPPTTARTSPAPSPRPTTAPAPPGWPPASAWRSSRSSTTTASSTPSTRCAASCGPPRTAST